MSAKSEDLKEKLGEQLDLTQDENAGFESIKLSADQGNLQAQIIVAKMYANGQGVATNLPKAREYMGNASTQEGVEANILKLLGEIKPENIEIQKVIGGIYVRDMKEDMKAFEWFERSNKGAGDKGQIRNANGFLYETGKGVTQKTDMAQKYYQAAAEQGYFLAEFNLGILQEQQNNFSEAEKHYDKAKAKKGELSSCYPNWEEQLATEAYVPIKMALLFRLGIAYVKALDVPQDRDKARGYFEQAAALDHTSSKKQLKMLQPQTSVIATNPNIAAPAASQDNDQEGKVAAEGEGIKTKPAETSSLTPAGQQQIATVTVLAQAQKIEHIRRELQQQSDERAAQARKSEVMQRQLDTMMAAFSASQASAAGTQSPSARREGELPPPPK